MSTAREGTRMPGGAGLRYSLVVLGALVTLGCASTQRPSACRAQIQSMPMANENGLQFGLNRNESKPLVTALITGVKVECVPAHHESSSTNNVKRDAYTDYELATTAEIKYTISNSKAFQEATRLGNADAALIVEGVSRAGVVLGAAGTTFRVVDGGTTGTASVKIVGISGEEIRRVAVVRARWNYGH